MIRCNPINGRPQHDVHTIARPGVAGVVTFDAECTCGRSTRQHPTEEAARQLLGCAPVVRRRSSTPLHIVATDPRSR